MKFRLIRADGRTKFVERIKEYVRRSKVRRWVRLSAVAKRLSMTPRRLQALADRGEFVPIVRKGRTRWVDEQLVVEWQRAELEKAKEAPARRAMRKGFVRGATDEGDVPRFLR